MRTETFPVQNISAKAKFQRRWWCKVHWVGYNEPTWEPYSNLQHCSELLREAARAHLLHRIPDSLKAHIGTSARTKAELMQLRRVNAKVAVKATTNRSGMGLFAAETLRPNTLVARFPYGKCDLPTWTRHCKRNKIPQYCAILENSSNSMLYDVTYSNQCKPPWVRMNHSTKPNVKVKLANGCVEFRTAK